MPFDGPAEHQAPDGHRLQAVKVAFIAIVIALLGVIAFEGFRLFSGPTQAESETQQKEDDNEYLDINTLKGDPNDGDDE